MDNLIPIVAMLIPIVAIGGWYAYNMVEKWHDAEEKRIAVHATQGAPELQRKVQQMEDEVALMRAELTGTVKDVDERLHRIELLLREVE